MRIGIYHGFELRGSGSNEYTAYLSHALADAGHDVHVICRETHAETFPFVRCVCDWKTDGLSRETVIDHNRPSVTVHVLPNASVQPVYLTDKQRRGPVKAFIEMTDQEIQEYHDLNVVVLTQILKSIELDVLHCNHVVYQPVAALEAAQNVRVPVVVYPHGSAIEYTVKKDERFKKITADVLANCDGLIIGNREVTNRLLNLYPSLADEINRKLSIVGVGVDTSLFHPVTRDAREQSVMQLEYPKDAYGKAPQHVQQLHEKLEEQGVSAVREFWNAYHQKEPDTDIRTKLTSIDWHEPVLLFVGALTAGKGLQSLIAAMPLVREKHPTAKLLIVGSGSYRETLEALIYALQTGNEALFDELCDKGMALDRFASGGSWTDVQNFTKERGFKNIADAASDLSEAVLFLGRLDHDRLCHLYPCADIAVFPSVVPEAYPLVFMEALSNGVFPIVSYFSGFTDAVDDVAPIVGDDWANAMKIVMRDDERIPTLINNINFVLNQNHDQLSRQFRDMAVERYDWSVRAQQMADAYKKYLFN